MLTREALVIEMGSRLRSADVVAALDGIVAGGRKPRHLVVNNDGGFSGRLLAQ